MKKIDTKIDITNLYEIYKNLLTEKQQNVFEQYYYEDESINEIASQLDISKNAVFNNLEKVKANLLKFESTLHIFYNKEFNISLLNAYDIDQEIINKIK